MDRRVFLIGASTLLGGCSQKSEAVRVGYLSVATHNAVIADPTGYVPGLYANVRSIFLNDLGGNFVGLNEPLLKIAFSAILAFDLKPYGPSTALTLPDCIADDALDCDNYAALACEFSYILNEGTDYPPAIVGWNGGAVGNHAQILATHNDTNLFCDPTVGFIAMNVSLDTLCRGRGVNSNNRKSFFSFQSARTNIAALESNVRNAVINGSYKASDLLYYAPSIEAYRNMGGSANWATPQSWNIH